MYKRNPANERLPIENKETWKQQSPNPVSYQLVMTSKKSRKQTITISTIHLVSLFQHSKYVATSDLFEEYISLSTIHIALLQSSSSDECNKEQRNKNKDIPIWILKTELHSSCYICLCRKVFEKEKMLLSWILYLRIFAFKSI